MCVYHCIEHNTAQNRTVLIVIIFPIVLQTVIIAQMLYTGEEELHI